MFKIQANLTNPSESHTNEMIAEMVKKLLNFKSINTWYDPDVLLKFFFFSFTKVQLANNSFAQHLRCISVGLRTCIPSP